jgi:RNA polymerase sigma-70 factor (ECF subfamily)
VTGEIVSSGRALTPEELSLFRSGDERFHAALIGQHASQIQSHILKITHEPQNCDDLQQDVWLRVCRHRDQYDGQSPFDAWLHRIVERTCLEEARKERRARVFRERFARHVSSENAVRRLDQEVVEAALDQEAVLEMVDAAILRLTPRRQDLIDLIRHGLSATEMGEVLGISRDAVRKARQMALARLRCLLDDGDRMTRDHENA